MKRVGQEKDGGVGGCLLYRLCMCLCYISMRARAAVLDGLWKEEKKHCLEETLLHSVYPRTNSLQIK